MSKQKVALITGCSNPTSLGAAMALTLLKRGWKVYATSIDVDSMTDLHKSGCEVGSLHLRFQLTTEVTMTQVLPLDVTKATDIEAAAKAVGDRLDLLVNNVGFFSTAQDSKLMRTGRSRRSWTTTGYGPNPIS